MTLDSSPSTLDESIRLASNRIGDRLPKPCALFMCATGVGVLPGQLTERVALPLGGIEGVPAGWEEAVLYAGSLQSLPVWLIDDEGARLGSEPSWSGGFPVWLAAAHGARCAVFTSAGCALPVSQPAGSKLAGSLAVATDHIRFGDSTPLTDLGPNDLGPLFPDLSLLHDRELRDAALARAGELGFPLSPAVIACTRGPALETRAEREVLASIGAAISVQSLAPPLLAAGHAGLRALSITAVTDEGDRPVDMSTLLANAEALAPKLDDLMLALVPDLEARVAALEEEHTA